MLSKNPNLETQAIPVLQYESTETADELELQNLISPETRKDRTVLKKSKPDEKLGHEFHKRWRDPSLLFVEKGASPTIAPTKREGTVEENSTGRERLKRHRVEVAGRVWIPEIWGQENFLKDWIDCTVFDAAVRNSGLMSARASLMEEGRRANSTKFRIENRC